MENELLDQVQAGDAAARSALLTRFREHLYRLVAERLDRRLSARLDLSDVVQEILLDADRRLDDYLQQSPRPLPPLGWLNQLASERLIDTHRRHVVAECRSVTREQELLDPWKDLEELLVDSEPSPSQHLSRAERIEQLRTALASLSERDRHVLLMRYQERLDVAAIAGRMELSVTAVKSRILRALLRLRDRLGHDR